MNKNGKWMCRTSTDVLKISTDGRCYTGAGKRVVFTHQVAPTFSA